MKKSHAQSPATVGVVEHGNSAVIVTIGADLALLDRRYIDLTSSDLPTHPHHHEGSWAVGRYLNTPGARSISLVEAVALVERVRAAAAQGAREGLDALATALTVPIGAIAIRICPPLPASVEACIADNRAQTVADSVMYRRALADAASARGWHVYWYDRELVSDEAAALVADQDIESFLQGLGKSVGAPWQAKHKLAAAAAIAAARHLRATGRVSPQAQR